MTGLFPFVDQQDQYTAFISALISAFGVADSVKSPPQSVLPRPSGDHGSPRPCSHVAHLNLGGSQQHQSRFYGLYLRLKWRGSNRQLHG